MSNSYGFSIQGPQYTDGWSAFQKWCQEPIEQQPPFTELVTELPIIRGRVWTGLLKRALDVEPDTGQRLFNAISRTRPLAATVEGLWAFAEWHEDFGDPDALRSRVANRIGDVLDEFGCAWIQRRRFVR